MVAMLDVIDGILRQARNNAAAPAIASVDTVISYGALAVSLARMSNVLAGSGVEIGAKVFINTRDPDIRLLIFLACLHNGAVPIAALKADQLGAAVRPDLVIATPDGSDADLTADMVVDQAALERADASRFTVGAERGGEDLLFIGTTSGTTGLPKVFAEKYGAYRRAMGAHQPLPPLARGLFTFGDATKYGVFVALRWLANGATLVRSGAERVATLKALNLFRTSHLFATPGALDVMIDLMEARNVKCPSVRQISITGSLFRPALIDRLERCFDAEIVTEYGTAEVGGISRGMVTSETYRKGYVGELLDHLTPTEVSDADSPTVLTFESDEPIYVHRFENGHLVRNDQRSYTVPDVGYLNGRSLYILGRSDEVFNADGAIIAYSALEDAVRELSSVKDAAVVSLSGLDDHRGLAVAVVASAPVDANAISQGLRRRFPIAAGIHDMHVFVVPELQRNTMGKVDRRALLDAFRSRQPV